MKTNFSKSNMRSNILLYGPSALAMLIFSINFYFNDEVIYMFVFLFLCILCIIQTIRYYKKLLFFKNK
ncbi:hypothetical protein BTGOE3_54040 [Bacillus thuringiensis]|nr:hypothetical protein BTGOE3_54040 [Bacillus thuringiensis]